MSDRPCISMVVPFFNSESTLAACIDSLIGQDDLETTAEILLVDNGSADASASIAAAYPEVTLLSEARPGAYAARNRALSRAAAPVIAFTDADCVVDPDWAATILERMRDDTVAVLLGHCRYPDSASLGLRLLQRYENAKLDYVLRRSDPAHYFGHGNNMAVRTSIFDELGPFEEWQRAGDTELVHRVATQRPDLGILFDPAMRITHLEFERGRRRVDRLRLYARTNAKIETFRELTVRQRLGILLHMLGNR